MNLNTPNTLIKVCLNLLQLGAALSKEHTACKIQKKKWKEP